MEFNKSPTAVWRGDPVTALHEPDPVEITQLFNEMRDAVSAGTASEVSGRVISPATVAIRTSGYLTTGDGGGAVYKRAANEPSHGGKLRSADGAWWEISEPILNQRMFGAVGDGVVNDYPALEAMLEAAPSVGVRIELLPGTHRLASGTPRIRSGTVLRGPRDCIWVQPTAGADVCGIYADVGVENVEIAGFTIRGPFWQPSDAGYAANPVQSAANNHGIHCRGRDYQARQSIPPTGTGRDVRVVGMRVEGFGEDAIQVDQVEGAWIAENVLTRCGRGGVRFYGVRFGHVVENRISYLSPGDALNNGNRMYGVTFTRRYTPPLSDYRPCEWCSARDNVVRFVPYWKALDTHGGRHIAIVNNQVENVHIAIGVDKGGYNSSNGIAPPFDVVIRGNQCIRTTADDPAEGDNGQAASAVFAVAHDQTDTHVGRGLVIEGNTFDGWGEDTRFGSVVLSNWIGAYVGGNVITNSRRAAICLRERCEVNLGPNTIDGVRRSTQGTQRGISVENANVSGLIGDQLFINRQATEMQAIYLTGAGSGEGLSVSAGHRFLARASGGIAKVVNPNNDRNGPWTQRLLAVARVNANGDDAGNRGIASINKTGTGTYVLTLVESALSPATLWPVASPRGDATVSCQADATTENTVTVLTKTASGALADGSFMIHVNGV